MPTCPNCGSYIPLGDHSCSCGTTISYDDSSYGSSGCGNEIDPDDNPFDYDFLNEYYHNDDIILCLNHMNQGIAEIEQKYNAKFRDAIHGDGHFVFSFDVETKYFDAIIRASYDTSYGYNYVELIRDIVTPDLSKLYSSEEFKEALHKKEREIGFKFINCKLGFVGDELLLALYFEGYKTFFLNGYDLNFME